jgi:hypothetical protein
VNRTMNKRNLLLSAVCWAVASACSTATTTQASAVDSGGDSGASDQGTEGHGGATSNQGSGGTPANGGSSGSTSVVLSCPTYCTAVQLSCSTESVKQYKSDQSCTASCAAFLLGSEQDTTGNTLGCRAHYATLATTDAAANCAAAGPSGGGKCGTNCDAYCALMARVCPTVFDDDALCRTACQAMAGVDEVAYRYGLSGDNLQCRIYHATFGAEGFPEIHCPHASPVPTSPCAS